MLLKCAIINLISNALIHSSGSTEIHVSLHVDDGIVLIIEDNGKGMTQEQLYKLFERYYRGTNTEVNTDGTGLGMAIAKQITQIHGGDIFVTSTQGQGTIIKIKFPVSI